MPNAPSAVGLPTSPDSAPSGAVPVAILGGHGHGVVVAEVLTRAAATGAPLYPAGFLNDHFPVGETLHGLPYLGPFDQWALLPEETLFIAPLPKPKMSVVNWRRVVDLGIPDNRWATCVDPSAHVGWDVRLGIGTVISDLARVGAGARIGRHCLVRAQSHVGHDVELADNVMVGVGAVLCGGCRIEAFAYLAPRCVIADGIRVGRGAVVGLGAVVNRDVPPGAVVADRSAKTIGNVPAEDLE